jgi:hypothetical protein
MPDDQIVKLLEEIRDLQKENLANQKIGLQNQQTSMQNQQAAMAVQRSAVQRNKILYVVLAALVGLCGLSFVIPVLSWMLSTAFRR